MSEDIKPTSCSTAEAAKEQPWKKLWPPKMPSRQTAADTKDSPWLSWEPHQDNPDEKPWVQWMNKGVYNPEILKREAAGNSTRTGVYPTRKRSDSAVTVAEGG